MFALDDERIDREHRSIIISRQNEIYTSITSFWEICIKHSIGKLKLDVSLKELFDLIENQLNIEILQIKKDHLYILNQLPFHHRDPFDRLIWAQSLFENITLLYTDQIFDKYKNA